MRPFRFLTLLLAATACVGAASSPAYFAYIGTYTGHGSQGIYVYRFEPITGEVTSIGLAAQTENPSFLAASPHGTNLYAVNENTVGSVSAFRINRRTGGLTPLNRVSSRGASPCALAVNHAGTFVLVANYGSGSVALLPIEADGSLAQRSFFAQHTGSGTDRSRQQGPHAHSASFSPDDRFALSADLGVDLIYVYRLGAARGPLSMAGSIGVLPGSGPRHLAFDPDGKFVYAINELSATVTAFAWNDGVLRDIGTVPALPQDYQGPKSGAEIEVHPNGRFLYASNRGEANDIAIFNIDALTGRLTPAGHTASGGRTPRSFRIDPTGQYLFVANQDSNNVVVFRIDPLNGRLTPTGRTIEVTAPVAVQFVAAE
ncbi:MAG: lactonase family protein [Bryobacteraceae bacterium]